MKGFPAMGLRRGRTTSTGDAQPAFENVHMNVFFPDSRKVHNKPPLVIRFQDVHGGAPFVDSFGFGPLRVVRFSEVLHEDRVHASFQVLKLNDDRIFFQGDISKMFKILTLIPGILAERFPIRKEKGKTCRSCTPIAVPVLHQETDPPGIFVIRKTFRVHRR